MTAGGLLHLLPPRPVHIAAGLGFLVLAVLALWREEHAEHTDAQDQAAKRDGADQATRLGDASGAVEPLPAARPSSGDAAEASLPAHPGTPAWVSCFLVVFAAEWGDLTQLATAALVARTGEVLAVSIGAVAALWSVTVLAATAGSQVKGRVSPRILNRASAVLFAAVGLAIIGASLH